MEAAEWYYIGHYGQLGPLTIEQVSELVEAGVIERDTFVWRNGMSDWLPAERVVELQASFRQNQLMVTPPPPPTARPAPATTTAPPVATIQMPSMPQMPPMPSINIMPVVQQPSYPAFGAIKSDKSRILAGLLQLIPPGGIGRMYLGYSAIGVLQFLMFWCAFVGYVWSIIDGIIILTGGTNRDGYGRVLSD